MKRTFTTDDIKTLSAVVESKKASFSDEQRAKFNPVVDKILGAEEKDGKYEVELSNEDEQTAQELLTHLRKDENTITARFNILDTAFTANPPPAREEKTDDVKPAADHITEAQVNNPNKKGGK